MPLTERGLEVVIPSKNYRKHPYDYDRVLYQARHLVENFFAKLKQYRALHNCGMLQGVFIKKQKYFG
jgi:transposase